MEGENDKFLLHLSVCPSVRACVLKQNVVMLLYLACFSQFIETENGDIITGWESRSHPTRMRPRRRTRTSSCSPSRPAWTARKWRLSTDSAGAGIYMIHSRILLIKILLFNDAFIKNIWQNVIHGRWIKTNHPGIHKEIIVNTLEKVNFFREFVTWRDLFIFCYKAALEQMLQLQHRVPSAGDHSQAGGHATRGRACAQVCQFLSLSFFSLSRLTRVFISFSLFFTF